MYVIQLIEISQLLVHMHTSFYFTLVPCLKTEYSFSIYIFAAASTNFTY